MLGLRVSEACQAEVTDLQYTGGYQVLHVLGKGSKPANIRCQSQSCVRCRQPSRVAPGADSAVDQGSDNEAWRRGSAADEGRQAGRGTDSGQSALAAPDLLYRRPDQRSASADMQYAMRHADARANLDRHAAHSVAAYLAGMAVN